MKNLKLFCVLKVALLSSCNNAPKTDFSKFQQPHFFEAKTIKCHTTNYQVVDAKTKRWDFITNKFDITQGEKIEILEIDKSIDVKYEQKKVDLTYNGKPCKAHVSDVIDLEKYHRIFQEKWNQFVIHFLTLNRAARKTNFNNITESTILLEAIEDESKFMKALQNNEKGRDQSVWITPLTKKSFSVELEYSIPSNSDDDDGYYADGWDLILEESNNEFKIIKLEIKNI
jgi:hypothetical protein